MYKRILLAYDGSVKVAPPFARVFSWHGNAVPRSFSCRFSLTTALFCRPRLPSPGHLFG